MPGNLIILGASVRAAAFSAIRAGFQPYAIDEFADQDLAAVCPAVRIEKYPLGFLAALAQAPAAPWMYTGGLENYPLLVQRLAQVRPLWGNGRESLELVRDPNILAQVLRRAELAYPRIAVGSGAVPRQQITWLCKRVRSGGGQHVRLAGEEDLREPPAGHYLQEFIAGTPCSALFVASGGQAQLLGATRQLIGSDWDREPAFSYAGSIGPLDLTSDETQQLTRLGNALAGEFGLVGLFGVDFIRTGSRLWTVEVNPRYTASVEILERALNFNAVALHAASFNPKPQARATPGVPPQSAVAFGSGLNDIAQTAASVHGKAIVYSRHAGTIPAALGTIAEQWNRSPAWPGLADIPRAGENFSTGQPIVTVFSAGQCEPDVEGELRQRVAQIEAVLKRH